MSETPAYREWKKLKIGDKVQIVSWPEEMPKSKLHPETIALYELLIASHIHLIVCHIDDLGLPTGKTEICDERGTRSEYLLLNHSGIQRVGQ